MPPYAGRADSVPPGGDERVRMMLVFGLAAAIWALGRLFGVPARARWAALAGLWALVVGLQAVLPEENRLRLAIGGGWAEWLVGGGVVALGFGYFAGLRWLRRRVPAPAVQTGPYQDGEFERYARHILLREIGGPGQGRLKAARVLVVGAGGLGSPALLYLATSGVGLIGVVDGDVVELSNLQRQIIHTQADLGRKKVASAADAMRRVNPFVKVVEHGQRLDAGGVEALLGSYDLVLDGTDNFDTRYLVNRTCARLGIPLISGAITQWEGQVSLFDPKRGGPCYECVFPERPAPGMVPSCAEAGVAAPLPGIIGSVMAMEAIKAITGAGEGLRGRLMIQDALYGETRVLGVKRRAGCEGCGGGK